MSIRKLGSMVVLMSGLLGGCSADAIDSFEAELNEHAIDNASPNASFNRCGTRPVSDDEARAVDEQIKKGGRSGGSGAELASPTKPATIPVHVHIINKGLTVAE